MSRQAALSLKQQGLYKREGMISVIELEKVALVYT